MTLHANTIPRLLLAICAAGSFSGAAQACGTRDGCISALMAAARAGDQVATGKVTSAFFVDENGKLKGVRKVGSSGHIALDLAAMTGVSACSFSPAIVDGTPAASWMMTQYVWTLE